MHRGHAVKLATIILGIGICTGSAEARDKGRSTTFEAVVACLTITNISARLACFDRSVAAMDEAERSSQIVVIDEQQVGEAERGLFGLSLPSVSAIFRSNRSNRPQEEIKQIESTIARADAAGYGKWTFVLQEGGTWTTTEAVVGRVPKVGTPMIVKRGSLGSYILSAEGSRSVRVRRLN